MYEDNCLDLKQVGYDIVEEHVRDLVRVLNEFGIDTASSCEGHVGAETEHVSCSFPWIAMSLEKNSYIKFIDLMRVLAELPSRDLKPWGLHSRGLWLGNKSEVFLYLRPFENNLNRDIGILKKLQEEAKQLAGWLQTRIPEQ